MTEHEVSRTLVKSPPELWAELSDASSLARHLGQFGEIRITRLEPETAVAWEGESARGTVRLEPSGWGTKVILEASQVVVESPVVEEPAIEPPAAEEPMEAVAEPAPVVEEPEAAVEPPPAAEPEPPVAPEPAVAPRRPGFFQRLFRSRGTRPAPEPPAPEPEPEAIAPEPEPITPEPEAIAPEPAAPEPANPDPDPPILQPPLDEALKAVLDSLGQAHHRPFSRA